MHPNGQMAAYEWNFGDVNPPVHAWSCMRVYQITGQVTGNTTLFTPSPRPLASRPPSPPPVALYVPLAPAVP